MDRAQADDDTDAPWTPPGMSLARKVGLTALMVMLGVIPGILLLASDPLGNSSDEVAPQPHSRPDGADAGNEAAVADGGDEGSGQDAGTPTEGSWTDAAIPDSVEDDALGSDTDDVEPDLGDQESEPRHRHHRRSSQVDGPPSAAPAEPEDAGEPGVAAATDAGDAAQEAPAPRHCLVLVCLG